MGNALIDTLSGLLAQDSGGKIILPIRTRTLLLQMLVAEKTGDSDHGIWQNGIYAAFHCAVASFRAINRTTVNAHGEAA
ncbi:MAG: hypothetical protein R3F11_13080 [Verrucomicrobiales bacterium]